MASENQSSEQDNTVQAKVDSTKPTNTKAGRGKAVVYLEMLLNIVVLGSVCFIGYMVYEQDKAVGVLFDQQNSYSSERNTAREQVNQLQETIKGMQSRLDTTREEISTLARDQDAKLDSLQKELISTRLGISNRYSAASQEWLLAESASLLRLAQQHLVVSRDVRTAQALYIAADDILKQIDDPAIYSVREILAGELAAIRAVPEVDIAAIYLQLGAVSDQVARLQVSNDLDSRVSEGDRITLAGTDEAEGMMSRFLASIKSTLDSYVVVRRRDTPLQALMTPGQEVALIQTISLQIEQARTALLKGQQEIYSNSLKQARDNIAMFLGGDAAIKNAVLSALDTLQDKRIISETPPLNRTRTALENILATRDAFPAEPATQSTGEQ